MQRLIIADPEMSGPSGHSFNYSHSLAGAALRRGLSPVILTPPIDDAHAGVADGITIRPVFRLQRRGASRLRRGLLTAASFLPPYIATAAASVMQRLRRQLREAKQEADADPFGRDLAKALNAIGPGAILLVHTITAARLATLEAALPAAAIDRLLIILRHSPVEMDQLDPASLPVAMVLTRLAHHFGDRFQLFADTPGLAALFAPLVPSPVGVVPIPVLVPPVRTSPPSAPPRVLYAGVARAEKGFARLPELVSALRGRAHFVIQSGPLPASTDPLVRQAHRILRAKDRCDLELIEKSLSHDDYLALLASADLIVLPYDAGAYGERSSGILAEALALGIPTVLPGGGWMAFVAGSSRCVTFPTPEMLCHAVEEALTELPALTANARAGAEAWRNMHNPDALLDALLRVAAPRRARFIRSADEVRAL
jgi:glycosyltransferase involved in cell wall biosynthesis